MDPSDHFIAINRAQLAGLPHFAAGLIAIYNREHGRPVRIPPASELVPRPAPPRPLFTTVTGRDFGRSIRWARTAANPFKMQIAAHKARVLSQAPCSQ